MRRFLALVVAFPSALVAQQVMLPASELSDYIRLLELQGKATGTPLVFWSSSLTPRVAGLTVDASHPWAATFPLAARAERVDGLQARSLGVTADVVYNSAFPTTANDGALWAGRGLSAIVRGGGEFRFGHITARIYPELTYAQNATFDLATGPATSRSPWSYPWHIGIDYPQRFGDGAVTSLGLGQSELRLDVGPFTAAASNENVWWGPGVRNAIVMGAAAPGFPHLDVGTGRALHTGIGDIEFRQIWGELSASSYSGTFPDGGRRFITGLTAGFRPAVEPNLTLGLTRVMYHDVRFGDWTLRDVLSAYGHIFNQGEYVQPDGTVNNDADDQLASATARWVFPSVGFETYVEYARNDFAGGIRDLFIQPDHSAAITIGIQKALATTDGTWVLKGEATSLAAPEVDALRGVGTFYVHGVNLEGYTNRGQLLGAAIGPGSNSQFLSLDRYAPDGRLGVFVQRVRYDDEYATAALLHAPGGYLSQQSDVIVGASMVRLRGRTTLGATIEATREFNRNFVYLNDAWNLTLRFSAGRR